MALTYAVEEGQGTPTVYDLRWDSKLGYLAKSHVYVYYGDNHNFNQIPFTWVSKNQIQLTATYGAKFTIRRIVPRSTLYNDYVNGAILRDKNLNDSYAQSLMVAEELSDGFLTEDGSIPVVGDLDMKGFNIRNVGAPERPTDAVRLVDLVGGTLSPGITLTDPLAYMRFINELPHAEPTWAFTMKFLASEFNRPLLSTLAEHGKQKNTFCLSGDLQNVIIRDSATREHTVDVSTLKLPVGETTTVSLAIFKVSGSQVTFRIYHGARSVEIPNIPWELTTDTILGEQNNTNSLYAEVFAVRWQHGGNVLDWSFTNVAPTGEVVCSEILYNGKLENGWAALPPEIVSPVSVNAKNVDFTKEGTSFKGDNADEVFREIDSAFVRKGTGDPEDPNDESGAIGPYGIWLVSTNKPGPHTRSLNPNPADGEEATIRDDDGNASANIITVVSNKSIMGVHEDMTLSTDWSWIRLKYFATRDDWRVVGGGIGAQVLMDVRSVSEQQYPVDSIYLTAAATNPAEFLQVGIWSLIGGGRALVGVGTGLDGNNELLDIPKGGMEGGFYRKRIEVNELPEHTHPYESPTRGATRSSGVGGSTAQDNSYSMYNTGVNASDNVPIGIVQPYLSIYVWKRIE